MKPAAKLQGAIDILRAILLDNIAPEKALLDWGRSHRFAGSSDRRNIHDTVYDVLRFHGTLKYYMQSNDPYFLVAGWIYFIKQEPLDLVLSLFNGEQHSPKPLPNDKIKLLKKNLPEPQNFEDKYNINPSLEPLFKHSIDQDLDQILECFNDRAPLDIRVIANRISLDDAFEQLQETFPDTEFLTIDQIPTLIRTFDHINLKNSSLFTEGLIEIQDGAAQYMCTLLSHYFKPERILDYCAGGGGKILALADLYHNQPEMPEMIASDISEVRLKSLKDRSERCGSGTIRRIAKNRLSPDRGLFDMVLIDSPCSGSGTWRRNVMDKLTTIHDKIAEYNKIQYDILLEAKEYVSPNGYLIYMTCSLFKDENDDIIKRFLSDNHDFKLHDYPTENFADKTEYGLKLDPYHHETDGFYMSILQKI